MEENETKLNDSIMGDVGLDILDGMMSEVKSGKAIITKDFNGAVDIVKQDGPASPDVSKVQVSDDVVSNIMEQANWDKKPNVVPKSANAKPRKVVEEVKPEADPKPQELVERFQKCATELVQILTEMTTCGALGVNMANNKKTKPDAMIPDYQGYDKKKKKKVTKSEKLDNLVKRLKK